MANSSTIPVVSIEATVASDPAVCRVSGFLKDIQNKPLKGEKLTIRHIYNPLAVSSDTLVLQEHMTVKSDGTGFITFDLLQGSKVRIELPNRVSDLVRYVTVPAAASVSLVGLILPYLVSVAFDDGAALSKLVDEQFSIVLTGTFSDGTTDVVSAAATWAIDDEDVLVRVDGNVFRALTAGTAVVSVTAISTATMEIYQEPNGDEIKRLDAPAVTLPTDLTVTVT